MSIESGHDHYAPEHLLGSDAHRALVRERLVAHEASPDFAPPLPSPTRTLSSMGGQVRVLFACTQNRAADTAISLRSWAQ
jgi:hypothetical protein